MELMVMEDALYVDSRVVQKEGDASMEVDGNT